MDIPSPHVLQANTPFEESLLWEMNRSYYEQAGLSAWSDGVVPHNMTSNSNVGKTYARLIIGFLKDHLVNGSIDDVVYIVELGSGHGRLAYHILKHLDRMLAMEPQQLPTYCYVLTDIVESNLDFFEQHPQLQTYLNNGTLDVSYFDGVTSSELYLRQQDFQIEARSLETPIIGIANYFFDSLPNQLYNIKGDQLFSCGLSLESNQDEISGSTMLNTIKSTIHVDTVEYDNKLDTIEHGILDDYRLALKETFLLIPRLGLKCIESLKNISKSGLFLIALDKGYSDISKLENLPKPEIILHGSFSLYVNFHALIQYCKSCKGHSMFSAFSDYSMQLGCFLFTDNPGSYGNTIETHNRYVNDFGPDDFNGLKKMFYRLINEMSLRELIAIIRLGHYDSTLFIKLLPAIRTHLTKLNIVDRKRLKQILVEVEYYFFNINEPDNVSYEIGGLLYDMAFYQDSLDVFDNHTKQFGESADIYYNKILCYYQLRMDSLFSSTLVEAKKAFPMFTKFSHLDTLDLSAE